MRKVEVINQTLIEQSYDYTAYRKMIDNLFTQGKTTGTNQSDSMINYAKMNIHRMKRLDKTAKILPDAIETVESISQKQIWLTITEGWCGDAAQIVPYIEQLAQLNPNIEHRLILRDEHLEVMDEFLTNGTSRSIPMTILLDADTLEVLGSWGPRPVELQVWYMNERKVENFHWMTASTQMHKWYTKDKGMKTQLEFIEVLKKVNKKYQLVF
jgi:hypothetical protein